MVKYKYKRVNDEVRLKFLRLVHVENYNMKDAAKELDIGYENAKIINRKYKQEGRLTRLSTLRRQIESS